MKQNTSLLQKEPQTLPFKMTTNLDQKRNKSLKTERDNLREDRIFVQGCSVRPRRL